MSTATPSQQGFVLPLQSLPYPLKFVGAAWDLVSMETDMPCIDTILRTFLEDASVGRSHHVGARYRRVMEHLRHYLEVVDANAVLGTDCGTLLAAEREVHPERAFARIFTAHDLVFCLSGFLDRPWLLVDPSDARTQVSLTSRLLQWIRRRYPDDLYYCSCGIYECKAAIRRARNSMRRPAGPQRHASGAD